LDKILVATRLDAPTHAALKGLADRHDRTVAYLVRKAVEQFVEDERKKEKGRNPAA
jgi:predicted transcriptional regulator